jgi:hypothetical protein
VDAVLFFTRSSVNASSSNATVYSEAWPKVPTKRWWIVAEAVWREDNARKSLGTGNMFAREGGRFVCGGEEGNNY